jgi:hypothetical protein
MTTIRERSVVWTFPAGWAARKFDGVGYQHNQFAHVAGGSQAVDITALDPAGTTLWLIEAKEFVEGRRGADKVPLPVEIATKVRDSLACIFAASIRANGIEQASARDYLAVANLRVVLHLEQRVAPPAMLKPVYNPADVRDKLKQLLRAIDPHPIVMSTQSPSAAVAWRTQWLPQDAQGAHP